MTYINYFPSPTFPPFVFCILETCNKKYNQMPLPPPLPHPTLNLVFKKLHTQFFFKFTTCLTPIRIIFFKKNEGPKPIQTKFWGQFWFQLWFQNILLQQSRYLLTGPRNGIGRKPEPDNTGNHTYSLVFLRKQLAIQNKK